MTDDLTIDEKKLILMHNCFPTRSQWVYLNETLIKTGKFGSMDVTPLLKDRAVDSKNFLLFVARNHAEYISKRNEDEINELWRDYINNN